jgi:uncharacterized phiE125 gp8 family phage protein
MTHPVSEKRTIHPVEEPITIDEFKVHARVIARNDDALIQAWIIAAREAVESYTERALVTQTWQFAYDGFPSGDMLLTHSPLQSITSINYLDAAGVTQTVSAAQYVSGEINGRGRVSLANGAAWPSALVQAGSVVVTAVCGYGNADKVPWTIRAAMLLLTAHLYEHREENSDFQVHAMPYGAERLLQPHRLLYI